MRFTISGADRATGRELEQTIDAKSASEAESIASLTMFVSKVTAEPRSAPAPVLPANDLEAAVLEVAAKPTVPYAARAKKDRSAGVDWATGLATWAWLLRGMSWVMAATTVPLTLWFLKEVIEALELGGIGEVWRLLGDYRVSRFIVAVALLGGAALLRIVAHLALALRHVATRADSDG